MKKKEQERTRALGQEDASELEQLPEELLAHIIGFLVRPPTAPEDEGDIPNKITIRWLLSAGATCRRLRAAVECSGVWRNAYVQRFLSHDPFQTVPHEAQALEDEMGRNMWTVINDGMYTGASSDVEDAINRGMRDPSLSEGRWRDYWIRDSRWATGASVEPMVARAPAKVALTTGRCVLLDDRNPNKPTVFVSCGNGRIHSYKVDRSARQIKSHHSYSVSNAAIRVVLNVMRVNDSYMTALHQVDDLLFAQVHGEVKVFRKGKRWAGTQLSLSVGGGWSKLAINKQKLWIATYDAWSTTGDVTIHDVNTKKAVTTIHADGVDCVPGMTMKENYFVVGGDKWLFLYDLRSGKKEKDLLPNRFSTNEQYRQLANMQFEQDDASDTFLLTSYQNETYVFNWETLDLKLKVPQSGYDVTYNSEMIALATGAGLHIADMHSESGLTMISGLGTSEFAYADRRKAINVCHAETQERIIIYDLHTGRRRVLSHPGGADHSTGVAVSDDLLITASNQTVAVWDFAPPS